MERVNSPDGGGWGGGGVGGGGQSKIAKRGTSGGETNEILTRVELASLKV